MGDADDAVAAAVAANRKVAASRLVRKDELDAELAKLRADRARVDAAAPGPEGEPLRQEIDARIAAATGELATVAAEYQAALAEMEELKKLAWRSKAPTMPAASDPVVRTPEEIALDNVRGHVADLEAQARVDEELAGTRAPATPAPALAPATAPARSREAADAEALAAFKALREKRDRPEKPAEPQGNPPPPKKTI